MSLLVILRVALKALARNKMRTALTMLGMIIGVAAVITMVALGNGAQEQIAQQAESAGTNLVSVRAGNHRRGGHQPGRGQRPDAESRRRRGNPQRGVRHRVHGRKRQHS